MKTRYLISLILGFAIAVFGQGTVLVRNIDNTDTSPSATSNGLIFLNNGTTIAPIDSNTGFNMQLYGGATAGSLTLLFSYVGPGNRIEIGQGYFFTPDPPDIATISGATMNGFFRIDAWLGSSPTISGASFQGTTGVFSNPLEDPFSTVPQPHSFTGMPALVIASVAPEPGTVSLAGLGAAVLLVFRRLARHSKKRLCPCLEGVNPRVIPTGWRGNPRLSSR